MRVAVIGTGGVGGFLGSLLARAGHDVHFLARGAHLTAIQERGLQVRSKQFGAFTVPAPATDDPAQLGQAELVLVAVKMPDFAEARQAARLAMAPEGVGLTIQNGLDAPHELARVVGADHVLTGTASIEAAVLEPGVIGHLVPLHMVTVSALHGPPTPRVERLVRELREAEIEASVAPDGDQALWDKASGLIPFATLTAAAETSIGPILALPETRDLLDALAQEAAAVALACGFNVQRAQDSMFGVVRQLAVSSPQFTSSMRRDFQAKKPTELEWLTGKLVRLADERGVAAPCHKALYAVLKVLGDKG